MTDWHSERNDTIQANNDELLKFFEYKHLPAHLKIISEPFCSMAYWICDKIPPGSERAMALRKLLESKDCAVRAML